MKKKPVSKFLWVTDPWSTLDHMKDTTLRLAIEARRQGHSSLWCDVTSIRLEDGKIWLEAFEILSATQLGDSHTIEASHFTSIQYRTDPPVDLAYLHPLQLLQMANPRAICNPAAALFMSNEKFEAQTLGSLMPPSLVSSRWEFLQSFGQRESRTVLKPLHRAQSQGVELLDWKTTAGVKRAKEILEKTSSGFTAPVILQRYLPGIAQGETRLWFLDGRLLAQLKKLPIRGDFRVNMDQGSRLVAHSLTAVEKKIARKIAAHLKKMRIRLAAVDVIDSFVTDFNFTSPGLIPAMEAVLKKDLAAPIIRALAKKAQRK